ncbi:Phosphatidylinositol 4-phosphate 5-kinase 2 [Micractinium conductrix]|uniref:1-phosphatidylinositol-4-phosphate 5-kinase n=1 Tax=Micractinium conductrix TaxID=554055 RepID=A0A2P6VRG5_9CHLO|nr:Phosphatidylinositol 4-phosphate 5-kinase 2 [Micractinium conductrix]|eukprot:PSC76693.1 Phosphatidylinositol 4-phosphate 5-kinase 2 [Micractinium conductrix]
MADAVLPARIEGSAAAAAAAAAAAEEHVPPDGELHCEPSPPRRPAAAPPAWHGVPDGTHQVRFADGSAYFGEWRGGRMHGRGVFCWPAGERYEGEWQEGQEGGAGCFYAPGRGTYYGAWQGGQMHGKCVYTPEPPGAAGEQPEDGLAPPPVVFLQTWDQGRLLREQVLRVAHKDVERRQQQRKAGRKQAKLEAKQLTYRPPKPGEAVYKGHRSYDLMRELQLGITFGVAQAGLAAPTGELGPRDFRQETSQHFPPGSETPAFRWKDYAPRVFQRLRQGFGIDNSDYLLSLTGDAALRLLGSPGKSGSVFFLSDDDRFLVKTVHKEEMRLLLELIPRYYRHVRANPATLLVHFYGVHRVTPLLGRRVRFIVMGSVLPFDLRLHRRYDLKGSSHKRTVGPARATNAHATLKDLDVDMQLVLPPRLHAALLRQLRRDLELLERLHVIDYSLLLGVHFLRWGNAAWYPPFADWPAPQGQGDAAGCPGGCGVQLMTAAAAAADVAAGRNGGDGLAGSAGSSPPVTPSNGAAAEAPQQLPPTRQAPQGATGAAAAAPLPQLMRNLRRVASIDAANELAAMISAAGLVRGTEQQQQAQQQIEQQQLAQQIEQQPLQQQAPQKQQQQQQGLPADDPPPAAAAARLLQSANLSRLQARRSASAALQYASEGCCAPAPGTEAPACLPPAPKLPAIAESAESGPYGSARSGSDGTLSRMPSSSSGESSVDKQGSGSRGGHSKASAWMGEAERLAAQVATQHNFAAPAEAYSDDGGHAAGGGWWLDGAACGLGGVACLGPGGVPQGESWSRSPPLPPPLPLSQLEGLDGGGVTPPLQAGRQGSIGRSSIEVEGVQPPPAQQQQQPPRQFDAAAGAQQQQQQAQLGRLLSLRRGADEPESLGRAVPAVAVRRAADGSTQCEPVLLYLGVIDFLQDYTLRKHLERFAKAAVWGGDAVSVAAPGAYSRRFMRAVQGLLGSSTAQQTAIRPQLRSGGLSIRSVYLWTDGRSSRRSSRCGMRLSVAASALVLLALVPARATEEGPAFLLLDSAWSPSFCWQSAQNKTPCPDQPWASFAVQGLVPYTVDGDGGSPYGSDCGEVPEDFLQQLIDIGPQMECWMPSFLEPDDESWRKGWKQWGSCAGFDNLTAYFNFTLAAAQQYDANALVAGLASQCGAGLALEDLVAAAKEAFAAKPWLACDAAGHLLSVQVCLVRNETSGAPQAVDCPAERDWQDMTGQKCGDVLTLPLGIEMPTTCAAPASPCNSVPSLPSACAKAVVLPENTTVGDIQGQFDVSWPRISWLNPTIPANATDLLANTTICLSNGPTPNLTLLAEPTTTPDWLPPWTDPAARQRCLLVQCGTDSPPPEFYANATLCGGNGTSSTLLGAALGNQMTGACGQPCMYNPNPQQGDDAVTAWRWDYDKACWMQDTRRVQSCPLGSDGASATVLTAELLVRQRLFTTYLANATAGATDLPADYSAQVQSAWDSFYASTFPPEDPTGDDAHDALGRQLNYGFAANSTGATLLSLPSADPLAQVQAAFAEQSRANDCQRATSAGFNSSACLCNTTLAYLHCNALAAAEAAAAIETALSTTAVTVDPAALKPDPSAQCSNPLDGEADDPLDTRNQRDLLDFMTNPDSEAPQQCCFTFGLGTPGVAASLCLQPGTNVAGDVAGSPVTQAASYQLPVCSYQDPLGTYGRDGVSQLLSEGVAGMSASLCLQGGGAVPALALLAPWFGPGVSIKDGRLCATGLSLTYTPLKAYSDSGLYEGPPDNVGVQLALDGYLAFKLVDALPHTPACLSSEKSQTLGSVVACTPTCQLNTWAFQGFKWAVTSGSDLFGWSRSQPLVQQSQWVDPQCTEGAGGDRVALGTWAMPPTLAWAAAALLLVLAPARAAQDAPDFLRMDSVWSPSFCWQSAQKKKPCRLQPWASFSVQGLVPFSVGGDGGSPYDSECGEPPADFLQQLVDIGPQMECWMPSFLEPDDESWRKGWKQWGSCAGFDNVTAYFNFTLAAAQQYDANALVAGLASQCGAGLARRELAAAAKTAFDAEPWLACDAAGHLLSVQVCLVRSETSGAPQAVDCPAERDWQDTTGQECGELLTLPLGIEMPASCPRPASPCNSVPSLASACAEAIVLPVNKTIEEDAFDVRWPRISWLNPTVPANATAVPAGTTMCLTNGPTPPLTILAEPTATPGWLPPWTDPAARQRCLLAQCGCSSPPPQSYANATLCGSNGIVSSALLAAALGNQMTSACGQPCMYNPNPQQGDDAVTAWRWDYDNSCWMQDTRRVQSCPLGSRAASATAASVELLVRQRLFTTYLAEMTDGATDLPANYTTEVQATWDAFHASTFPPDDPTGNCAHEALGRQLNDGFAAASTGAALLGLPSADPLARVQAAFAEQSRANDCQRATFTGFNSSACLCNTTLPYLHCNALAAVEAAAAIEAALSTTAVAVDPAALKPDPSAQCSNPLDGEADDPLDARNQPDLLDFFTNRTAEAPQQCCFTFGLGAPGVTASLCLQSGTNVTADVADSPVTQAASYQLPVCSYQDPLGTYGRDGVNELLSKNGVDMSTSLCLQGGGAVPALAPLSPWFGPGVSIKDGRLCATGLSLTYTPLKAYSNSGLYEGPPDDVGVQLALDGYLAFKLVDALPHTPACLSSEKSQTLDSVVACTPVCQLNAWGFQGFEWAVTSGSDLFGWSRSQPLVQESQWVDPQCTEGFTLFKGGDIPACPPPPPSPPPPSPPPPSPPPPVPSPSPPPESPTPKSPTPESPEPESPEPESPEPESPEPESPEPQSPSPSPSPEADPSPEPEPSPEQEAEPSPSPDLSIAEDRAGPPSKAPAPAPATTPTPAPAPGPLSEEDEE